MTVSRLNRTHISFLKLSILALITNTIACASDPPENNNMGGSTGGAGQSSVMGGNAGAPIATDCAQQPAAGIQTKGGKRYVFGTNYAWGKEGFGQDFGGVRAWGGNGVAFRRAQHLAALKDMHDSGVQVVRWWIYPVFWGEAVQLDAQGAPSGLGGTFIEDLNTALDLAKESGVFLQPTLFSFDNFRRDETLEKGVQQRSLKSIAIDPMKRAKLMENIVRATAKLVAASPNKDRVVSWDVINEPEWATSGTTPYGDPAFDPQMNLDAIPFAEMEAFVLAAVKVLREENAPLITVGSAAIKWGKAWSKVGLDFYTVHMYDWVNQYFPYKKSLAQYGVTDKPVVMGEFPIAGLKDVPLPMLLNDLYDLGYAGAMAWAVTDGPWNERKGDLDTFAKAKGCVLQW